KWAVNAGLDVAIAPEPSIRAAEAHDRLRFEAAQLLDVPLHDTDDLAVGVDPRWQIAVALPNGGFGKRLQDVVHLREHLLPRHPQRETDVSLKGGARRHLVDLHAASDGADVECHLVDDTAGAGAHGAVHRGTTGVDRSPDIIG